MHALFESRLLDGDAIGTHRERRDRRILTGSEGASPAITPATRSAIYSRAAMTEVAECHFPRSRLFVLEIAARPIGCSLRTLRKDLPALEQARDSSSALLHRGLQ